MEGARHGRVGRRGQAGAPGAVNRLPDPDLARTWLQGTRGPAASERLPLLTLGPVRATQHVHPGCCSLPGIVKLLVLLPRRRFRSRVNVFQRIGRKFTLLGLFGRSTVASQLGGDQVPRDAMMEGCPPSGLASG